MALLELRSLRKSFEPGKAVVDDVTFSVNQGEIICLLGPSGCGKTTLLRSIAGLEAIDTGTVVFDGREVNGVPPHQRDFGMMFQEFALFPHKNVFDNVAFGLQMHRETMDTIHTRVNEMLELVDLVGYDDREIERLSGGEQQRVALARALAPRPRLLMLDEPLGALDRALRQRLMIDLREILKLVGVTSIYVTHDQTEAFAVSDRIAVMNKGHIEQFDLPQKIFYEPLTPFVAHFLGFSNFLDAEVIKSNLLRTVVGDLIIASKIPQGTERVILLIRPEAATVLQHHESQIINHIAAEVQMISFRGKYYQVKVGIGDQTLLFEIPEIAKKPGDLMQLSIDPNALRVLPV